jgi:hypothetical protein
MRMPRVGGARQPRAGHTRGMAWHRFATLLLVTLCCRHACQSSGLGVAPEPEPEPESEPLPSCPAFANGAQTNGVPDELAHACTCEITEGSGCRGITPRFNWIIASCDRPDGVPGVGGTGNAQFPRPPDNPPDYFSCADPMRLRPGDNNASVVQLRYIAAYQWGEPCEVTLAALCPYNQLRQGATCTACTRAHQVKLLAAGCSAPQLAEACDTCGIAMRNATWIDHEPGKPPAPLELCVELGGHECEACLGQNQEKLVRAQCGPDRLNAFCQQRNWTMDTASSVNTNGALPVLDLGALERKGGASMWDRGAYMPQVRGLGPPGMMFAISCQQCSSFAWFILNQGILDRGPDKPTCANPGGGTDNCWTSASAGELDLLETGFWDPAFYNTSRPDGAPNPNRNNSRHYLTSSQGSGRCLPVNNGVVNPQDKLKAAHGAGGACSNSYFVDDGQPHLYAAVVDRRGVTVYRDPEWAGLTPTTAQAVLGASAPARPHKLGAPCEVGDGSCAANTPACLTRHPPPEGQPDCRTSVTPPADYEGYEECTPPPPPPPKPQPPCQCYQCGSNAPKTTFNRCGPSKSDCSATSPANNGCYSDHCPNPAGCECATGVCPQAFNRTQLAEAASSHSEISLRRLGDDTAHGGSKQDSLQNPIRAKPDEHEPMRAKGERSSVFSPPMSCCHATPAPAPATGNYNYSCISDALVKGGFVGRVCRDPNCDKGTDQDSCTAQTWSYDSSKACVWDPAPRCSSASRDGADYWGCCGTYPVPANVCPFQCEGTPAPPPPPPPPPVYCCNCAANSCLQSKHITTDTYCTDPSATCVEVPPGVKCPSGQGSMGKQACEDHCNPPPLPACSSESNWWDLFADTGQHSTQVAGCDTESCPYPLEEDCLGQTTEGPCAEAGCDWNQVTSECRRSRCNFHPFCCCDCHNTTGSPCQVWNGMDEKDCMSGSVHEMDWEMGLGKTCNDWCGRPAQLVAP